MKLIATKPMRYNTRRLLPGDEFEALSAHGRLLIGIRKAVASPNRVPGQVSRIPAELAARVAKANERDDLGKWRDQAKAAGIEIDNRWGVKRLQSEIDAKKHPSRIEDTPAEPGSVTAVPADEPADDGAGQD